MPSSPPAEPFILYAPQPPEAPVVFDSPHSGTEWPANFASSAPQAALLSTWDAFVDELWAHAPAHGATLLAARFPRAFIDVNRAEDDIDPTLLAEPWPTPLATTDYSRRGMGLIRRLALPDMPMYEKPLSVADVEKRIRTLYRPYRRMLKQRLDHLRARHGAVWHVNCHSMKSRGNRMNVDAGKRRPDIVVSDRDGLTAASAFTRWTADWFSNRGFTVKVNDPYRGGDLIVTHGDPSQGRHSIQIEINRALYLDEAAFTRSAGFDALQRDLGAFAAALVTYVKRTNAATLATPT